MRIRILPSLMRCQGRRSADEYLGRKAIVVLTDGLDNVSKGKSDDVLAGISEGGFSISTIGLGDPEKQGSMPGWMKPV